MSNDLNAYVRRAPVAVAVSAAILFAGPAAALEGPLTALLSGSSSALFAPFAGAISQADAQAWVDANDEANNATGTTLSQPGPCGLNVGGLLGDPGFCMEFQEQQGYARNGSYVLENGEYVRAPLVGDDQVFVNDAANPWWWQNHQVTFSDEEGDDEPTGLFNAPAPNEPNPWSPDNLLDLGTLRVGSLLAVDLPNIGGALFGPGTAVCASAPLVSLNLPCLVSRVIHATGVDIEILRNRVGTYTLLSDYSNLLAQITANGLGLFPTNGGVGPEFGADDAHMADGTIIKDGAVIIGWAGDEIHDDGVADSDIVYVLDTEPMSTTYGQVIWTAGLPALLLANQMTNGQDRYTSDTHNDPHHGNTYNNYVTADGRKLFFTGGLLTANMFRFDITDPRRIQTAELAFCGGELARSSLADDIFVMPRTNPETGHVNMVASYMNGIGNAGPGTLVEFHPERMATCQGGAPYNGSNPRQYLAEHDAAKVGGPTRNRPNEITGNTDTGLEAYPHGVWPSYDGHYIASSDYAVSATIGAGQPTTNAFDALFAVHPNLETVPAIGSIGIYGTTVRLWDASDLSKGPIDIAQVPDGPRIEGTYYHEEDQGLMPFGMLRQNKGAFVGAMCGGTLFYSPNVRRGVNDLDGTPADARGWTWHAVWDVGPCSGVSVFQITPDDHYYIGPVAGIVAPGDPTYERDYVGEHDRRINVLDITPLTDKGPDADIECSYPDADPSRPGNSTLGLKEADLGQNPKDLIHGRVHNNGADDCPILVGQVVHNTPENYASMGGGHYVHADRAGTKTVNLDTVAMFMNEEVTDRYGLTYEQRCLRRVDIATGMPKEGNLYHAYSPAGDYGDGVLAEGEMWGLRPYCRVAWANYFVDVDFAGIQGTGSGGDKKVMMTHFNPVTGELVMDTTFRDEITGEVGVAMMGPGRREFYWPGTGVTGGKRPHGFDMNYKGAIIKEPYQNCQPHHENDGSLPIDNSDCQTF